MSTTSSCAESSAPLSEVPEKTSTGPEQVNGASDGLAPALTMMNPVAAAVSTLLAMNNGTSASTTSSSPELKSSSTQSTATGTTSTTTSAPKGRVPAVCAYCGIRRPKLQRPKTGSKVCQECFISRFEEEIHETIINNDLFQRGERVVIGASGGKDSTVLIHVMTTLNKRYDYGIELILLSIDEGITGYRDDSLETVKKNQKEYGVPLTILSYKDLYGWSMDEIVKKIGPKGNCTICGVFRRQALDRGAMLLKADKVLTGHNCDDIAETVILNRK